MCSNASQPRPEAASPVDEVEAPSSIVQGNPDPTTGGEAPGRDEAVPEGWGFGASCSGCDYWSVTLVRLGDGRYAKGISTTSMPDAWRKARDQAQTAPAMQLAEGCCSAVSPCSHQRRSPYTICNICQRAAGLSASPRSSQKEEG